MFAVPSVALHNTHTSGKSNEMSVSNQIGHIHGHLVDLCRIILFNIAQDSNVVRFHEVDGDTFASETARTTDSVDIQLLKNPKNKLSVNRKMFRSVLSTK